jgi:hypothetical protein
MNSACFLVLRIGATKNKLLLLVLILRLIAAIEGCVIAEELYWADAETFEVEDLISIAQNADAFSSCSAGCSGACNRLAS